MFDLTYADAVAKAEHLIALGDTSIYLRDESGFPWSKVVSVEEGVSWRLSGPSSARIIAEDAGLRFSLSVDFEGPDANGRGISLFDREHLRGIMQKLPPAGRTAFAKMLATKVLPPLQKRTAELRKAMNSQMDSEDCVRGLIAWAENTDDK